MFCQYELSDNQHASHALGVAGRHPASGCALPRMFFHRQDNRKASLNSTVDGADVCQTYGRTAMMRSLMGVEEEIEDYRRMAMRYPVRIRSSQRERMGGLTWSPRSNTRPRTSRGCVTL